MEKEFEQIDKAGSWAAIYQVREHPGARQALGSGRANLPLRPLGAARRLGPAACGLDPTAAEAGPLSAPVGAPLASCPAARLTAGARRRGVCAAREPRAPDPAPCLCTLCLLGLLGRPRCFLSCTGPPQTALLCLPRGAGHPPPPPPPHTSFPWSRCATGAPGMTGPLPLPVHSLHGCESASWVPARRCSRAGPARPGPTGAERLRGQPDSEADGVRQ